jgi:16S rRNA (adenine1518-N6/adenine1519-N6)-dimethyltransferase
MSKGHLRRPVSSGHARKRFAQHFLAPAWADKVVRAIAPRPSDHFLEIGPGAGALTSRLAARAAHVTAIEVDRDLAAELQPRLPANVNLVVADILDVDLTPYLDGGPLRIAGNLPYNISSPILFKLLAAAKASADIVDATVMLQLEVAERLAAAPSTRDYGVLTIFTTAQADVTRLLTLPPGAFRPAPRVHSAVVRLTFKPSLVPPGQEALFEKMVRTMFMQRRKTLLNALRPFAESVGEASGEVLAEAGIDSVRRPETLTIADLLRLVSVFTSSSRSTK